MPAVMNSLPVAVCMPHGSTRSGPDSARRQYRRASRDGFSVLELLVASSIAITLVAMALPAIQAAMDDVRAASAARYVATRLQQVRSQAISRSGDAGWEFSRLAEGYTFT